ncbi:hypothetical protein BJ165DRAFT_318177 [Panaeolus papilionaceus]|nr:hypothetical protein BJ165DRAFT_318177 [Panaeolus papilionaceus]
MQLTDRCRGLKTCKMSVTIQLPSSFLQHLSGNSALSAAEISEVKEFQMEAQNKERVLNQKIRQLQDELVRAQYEMKQASKQSLVCNTSLSPFRTLPSDILYQVARQLPVYESPSSTTHIPSILCQVSTSWRDVTYGMPRAWQLIRLSNQQETRYLQGRLEYFARLSDSLPLTVEMHSSKTFAHSSNAELVRWLLSKWEGRDRLGVLVISTASPLSVFQGILSSSTLNEKRVDPETSIPLQSLRIEVNTAKTITPEKLIKMKDVEALLDRFPSIHSLWLDQHPRSMQDYLSLGTQGAQSLSNLTKLSLVERFQASDFLDPNQHCFRLRSVLKLFPMLEVAYLSIRTDSVYEGPYAAPSDIVTHENLKELALNLSLGALGIDANMILSGFCFSALSTLRLEWNDSLQYLDKRPFATSRIFPSLQTLVISRKSWCSFSLSHVLHPLSTVTDLTIITTGSLHFEGIQSLVANPHEDMPGGRGAQYKVHLPPKLIKLQLQFLSHWDWLAAGEKFEHCITELRSSLSPSISISLALVVREVNTIKVAKLINGPSKSSSVASRKTMLQYFLTLGRKFKESLNIDVDILENDDLFPLNTLRDQLIPHFN